MIPAPKVLSDYTFGHGNFGLWFYKYVPICEAVKDFGKACDGKHEKAAEYYEKQASKQDTASLKVLLQRRHARQEDFLAQTERAGAKLIAVEATLISRLALGMGIAHPSENGLCFDHTLGIPYIPASSLKGAVLNAHCLALLEAPDDALSLLLKEDKEGTYLDLACPETLVPCLFGSSAERGQILFLDAYPTRSPKLEVDIINCHLGEYYHEEGDKRAWPHDALEPVPVKFLAVAAGTTFAFRLVVHGKAQEHLRVLKNALELALGQEGLGGKTAVGYGRFGAFQFKKSQEEQQQEASVKAEAFAGQARKDMQNCFDKIPSHKYPGEMPQFIQRAEQELRSDLHRKGLANHCLQVFAANKELRKSHKEWDWFKKLQEWAQA